MAADTYVSEYFRTCYKRAAKNLSLSIPLLIILFGFAIYFFVKIWQTVTNYLDQKREMEEMKNKRFGGISLGGGNIYLDSTTDNEVYGKQERAKEDAEAAVDDYAKFTSAIQNSFKDYQTYNKKLKDYYQGVRNTDAPDQIDQSALLDENDNY